MALDATIYAAIVADYDGSHDLATLSQDFRPSTKTIALANGTGENQATHIWSDQRTLAASASEELDLAGSLVDAFGTTLTFTIIKAIYIKAAAANTNDVVVGNAASNGFVGPFGGATHTIEVRPGGVALLVAPETGWTVTAGTGDKLKIANESSGSSVTYDITIIGLA